MLAELDPFGGDMRTLSILLVCLAALPSCKQSDSETSSNKDLKKQVIELSEQLQSATERIAALDASLVAATDRIANLELANTTHQERLVALQSTVDADQPTLQAAAGLLSYVSVTADKDILIEGANLQVVSGADTTEAPPNGKGNIIIGYNESVRNPDTICRTGPRAGETCTIRTAEADCGDFSRCDYRPVERTGSHNLIIGPRHSYNASGCLVVGDSNNAFGDHSVVFGSYNSTADSGLSSSPFAPVPFGTILGGAYNRIVNAPSSSIAGGKANEIIHSVSGCISGGTLNRLFGDYAAISGGTKNHASGDCSVISGGRKNYVSGERGVISGGAEQSVSRIDEYLP